MIRRMALSAIGITAASIVAWTANEHYAGTASIPTKDDRCTGGFGSTFHEDGRPVACGEQIDPVKAVRLAYVLMQQKRKALERCVTGDVLPVEAELLDDFAGQYGEHATCKSSIVKQINAGNYAAACEVYPRYKYAAGYDCSTPGNKRCAGVWKRALWRRDVCRGAQNGSVTSILDVPKPN